MLKARQFYIRFSIFCKVIYNLLIYRDGKNIFIGGKDIYRIYDLINIDIIFIILLLD